MKEKCRVTLERAYLYLDGEVLSREERIEIKEHLEACQPCLERYGMEAEVTALLAKLRGQTGCPSHVKVRIEKMFTREL